MAGFKLCQVWVHQTDEQYFNNFVQRLPGNKLIPKVRRGRPRNVTTTD